MIKLNNQNTALHIYFCLVYLQCGHGEVAELVDATREFGTLLFTGLEIQWLPLYRFESDLLHIALDNTVGGFLLKFNLKL